MLTHKLLLALVGALALVALVIAGVFLRRALSVNGEDLCNSDSHAPYSAPVLTPFGTSTAVFIRFNVEGNGCAYIPATDAWTNLSKLVNE